MVVNLELVRMLEINGNRRIFVKIRITLGKRKSLM